MRPACGRRGSSYAELHCFCSSCLLWQSFAAGFALANGDANCHHLSAPGAGSEGLSSTAPRHASAPCETVLCTRGGHNNWSTCCIVGCMAAWIACAACTLAAPVRSPAAARVCSPSQTHAKYASRFPMQQSEAKHAVRDGMAIVFLVSAVVHTTGLRGKAGAWNMVVGKRDRRRGTCA